VDGVISLPLVPLLPKRRWCLLAIGPPRERPHYEPTKRRLTWPNDAIATTYSADEPERLRGPQHDWAWCDELASWRYPEAWDMQTRVRNQARHAPDDGVEH
jgi:phage terminase large subunit-like protein